MDGENDMNSVLMVYPHRECQVTPVSLHSIKDTKVNLAFNHYKENTKSKLTIFNSLEIVVLMILYKWMLTEFVFSCYNRKIPLICGNRVHVLYFFFHVQLKPLLNLTNFEKILNFWF